MMPHETDRMFGFKYEKTADEIKAKAEAKITALGTKIEERQKRIADLRDEYGIDDGALAELLTQARRNDRATSYTYSSNAVVGGGQGRLEEKTIGAGVVNHLLTENDFIEADKSTVERLQLVVRNLRPLARTYSNGVKYEENGFQLSYEELKFLGF